MGNLELIARVIVKMVMVNGLAILIATIIWLMIMATITNIKNDKSWFKKSMRGNK